MKETQALELRAVSRLLLLPGAAGSVAMMAFTGRHGHSIVLFGLFTGWVLLPFVALFLADKLATRWSAAFRRALHFLMLILSIASLSVYAAIAFGPPRPQPAFYFLIVPLVSLALTVVLSGLASIIR